MNFKGMILAAGVSLALAGGALAQGMEALKKQMIDRKPAVEQLLEAGRAGENRSGLLEALGKLSEAEAKVLAAENADRKTVYAAIGARNGTDAAKVGEMRAAEIAAKAKPGTKVQGKDGAWSEKK
jgi:uncharacterized protein YdbL (DUF1318 family)